MNYNDSILENKMTNFLKDFMYKLALSICIVLAGALVFQYCFHYDYYYVKSGSERPIIEPYNDLIVIKKQEVYKPGDIIEFDDGLDSPVVHRLIYIKNGTYFCHGDNVSSLLTKDSVRGLNYYKAHVDENATKVPIRPEDWNIAPEKLWEIENGYIQSLFDEGMNTSEVKAVLGAGNPDVQYVNLSKIYGKVVAKCSMVGLIVFGIKEHTVLLITLVAGVWCLSTCLKNELDMMKARRFE